MKYSKSSPSRTFGLDDYIQFILSSVTYSIDGFNAKIKTTVLRQKQNWNVPQSKNLKLVVPENYHSLPAIIFSLHLVCLEKLFKKN